MTENEGMPEASGNQPEPWTPPPAEAAPPPAAVAMAATPPPAPAAAPATSSAGSLGCAPLAFTAIGSALLGAVLALAILAYVNDGQLQFATEAVPFAQPDATAAAGAKPEPGAVLTPAAEEVAASAATTVALQGTVTAMEAAQAETQRQLEVLLKMQGLSGIASRPATGTPAAEGTAQPAAATAETPGTATPSPEPSSTPTEDATPLPTPTLRIR
jgi:hypothetical protein